MGRSGTKFPLLASSSLWPRRAAGDTSYLFPPRQIHTVPMPPPGQKAPGPEPSEWHAAHLTPSINREQRSPGGWHSSLGWQSERSALRAPRPLPLQSLCPGAPPGPPEGRCLSNRSRCQDCGSRAGGSTELGSSNEQRPGPRVPCGR